MATIAEFAASNNLSMTSMPVGKHVIDGKSPFKYMVTIKKGKSEFTTEFTMGSGHVGKKNFKGELVRVSYQELNNAIKKVRYGETIMSIGMIIKPIPPSLDVVLECLQVDVSCVNNAATFEEFAKDMGYNPDSIKDKAIYDACVATYFKLKAFFGSEFENFMNSQAE